MRTSQVELLKIIARKECPFCEGSKLEGCMFCDACYQKLTQPIKDKIKNALRNLSEAIIAGVKELEG